MNEEGLDPRTEAIAEVIVNSGYAVHDELGPGLLEKVYESCFCYELEKTDLSFRRQVELPIVYDGKIFDEGLRLDVLVEDCVICELKASEKEHSVWEAQLLSYLEMTENRLGFLINFEVPLIKEGINRFIK